MSHEASLIVPDFTFSLYGSSCIYNYVFLASLLLLCFYFIYWHPKSRMEGQDIDRDREKKR